MATKLAIIDADSIVWNTAYYNRENESIDFIALRAYLDSILNAVEATHYCGFIGAEKTVGQIDLSLRKQLFPIYKSQRPPRPDWLVKHEDGVRTFLSSQYGFQAVPAQIEADDACAIAKQRFNDMNPIICGIDKDLKQIPGNHYNYSKGTSEFITVQEADLNLFMQVLTGDNTDGIGGISGVGPARAAKIIGDRRISTISSIEIKEELYQRVIREFTTRFGVREGLDKFTETYFLVKLKTDFSFEIKLNEFQKYDNLFK